MVHKYAAVLLCVLPLTAPAQTLPADPTRPSGIVGQPVEGSVPAARTFILTYVKSGSGQPAAIINGQRVKVGSWVDGARVVQITTDGARLETDKGTQMLKIGVHAGFNKQKSSRN